MFDSIRDKTFLKKLWSLAIPIAMQELLMASLHLVDTAMIGRVEGPGMASVTLANQPFFIFLLLGMGITSGASLFSSQYFGKKDMDGVARCLGMSLFWSLLAASAAAVLLFFFPEPVLNFYSEDPEVITLGASYLKIVAPGFLFTAATMSLSTILRSTKQPKIPLAISIVAISLNTLLNYLLIFGKAGLPGMGVEGAAIATLIARGVETVLLFAIVYERKNIAAAPLKKLFVWPKEFRQEYRKAAIPVVINDIGWALGFSIYNKFFAALGTDSMTAISIAYTVNHFFLVLFFGTGHATGVVLGNQMGRGELEESHRDAWKIIDLMILVAVGIGVVIIAMAPLLPKLFNASAEVAAMNESCMIMFALFLPMKIINMHVIPGILRSGGDTLFAAILDIGGVWLIGIPLAWLGASQGFPIGVVYGMVMIEELIKCIIALWRMESGKWLKTIV